MLCKDALQLGPRPVIQAHPKASILIVGQAPATKVHETGFPFDDPSGKRLREWMGVDRNTFYDKTQVAIVPMGFCYPRKSKSGDLPPRKECAIQWRVPVLEQLKLIQLTLVIGQYAMAYHLPQATGNLTDIVKSWQKYKPHIIPLPHPSPRNNVWLKRNPWFEEEIPPYLQRRIRTVLKSRD